MRADQTVASAARQLAAKLETGLEEAFGVRRNRAGDGQVTLPPNINQLRAAPEAAELAEQIETCFRTLDNAVPALKAIADAAMSGGELPADFGVSDAAPAEPRRSYPCVRPDLSTSDLHGKHVPFDGLDRAEQAALAARFPKGGIVQLALDVFTEIPKGIKRTEPAPAEESPEDELERLLPADAGLMVPSAQPGSYERVMPDETAEDILAALEGVPADGEVR